MGAMRVLLALLLPVAAVLAHDNPYANLLKARGIGTDRASLAAYLETCIPTPETPRLIEALLDDLGNGTGAVREAAVRRLSQMPFLAAKAVHEVSLGDDPELRRICKRILSIHKLSRSQELLNAVLHTIRLEEVAGLAPLLLDALPHCEEGYLLYPAQRALVATARAADAELLTAALDRSETAVRAAATEALGRIGGSQAAPRLRRLLADPDDTVRLVAAETLLAKGDRAPLAALVGLLDSRVASVRFRASAVLRAVTGQRFGYVSYATAADRAEPTAKWARYIRAEGPSVKLRLPLTVRPQMQGRTLICSINTKRLEEYDRVGKRVFQSDALAVPWGCAGLPNGHRLVAVFSDRVVIEFNREGREVWRSGVLPGPPMSVRRLDSRNTLISCSDSGKVIEMSPRGHIVWSITLPGRPIDARRLESGRTLVTLYQGKRVVEVDRKGAIVWKLEGPSTPSTAQRLANGNTLVAGLQQHSTVSEHDRAGRIVWKLEGLGTVYEAQRLPNGNTLVGTSSGAREYDPQGHVVWKKDIGPCRIARY